MAPPEKLCVSHKLCPTSKIRAVRKLHRQSALSDDAADSVLDEVHFLTNGAFPYDVIMRLEYLKTQLGQHGRHKVWLCVGKQRHGCHQFATVEVYNFLRKDTLIGHAHHAAVKCFFLHA